MAALVASLSGHARASGAWISSGALQPIEQRVAVSVGPDRTTLWTSLRFDAAAGKVGIIVPAPPGSSLDFSTDAWFEALETATAPRVFPPGGESPYCPGQSGPSQIFDIAGQLAHVQSLPVDDVAVLDDAGAVSSWAAQAGLDVSPALAASLGALGGVRFVAVRFAASGGPAVTRTLRVAMPGAPPLLPLALTRAGTKPLLVTSWTIGGGRATASKSVPVTVSSGEIVWDAKEKKSNYAEARSAALAAEGNDGVLTECAGSEPLATNLSIAEGTASIDGLVTALFERTAAYGDGQIDPTGCISAAAVAMTSSSPVAASCARADLGVVDPGVACVESVPPGRVDPAKLRCGGSADDLAVALSGLVPAEVWLTRQSLEIPAGSVGVDWSLVFNGGPQVSPVRTAKSLDLGGCNGASTSSGVTTGGVTASSSSATSSSATGAGGTISVGVGVGVGGLDPTTGVGQGGSNSSGGFESSGSGAIDPAAIDVNCGCSGTVDTAGTGSDSCDGSSDSSSDSCSGDGSEGDSCTGDGSDGDTCSGDSSGSDSCDGSSSGADSCDGSSGGDSCDSGGADLDCSGGSGDCAVSRGRGHKRPAPRLSVLSLALVALIAPLRRRGRRARAAVQRG